MSVFSPSFLRGFLVLLFLRGDLAASPLGPPSLSQSDEGEGQQVKDLVTLSEAFLKNGPKDLRRAFEQKPILEAAQNLIKDFPEADLKGAQDLTEKRVLGPRCQATPLQDLMKGSDTTEPQKRAFQEKASQNTEPFGRGQDLAPFSVFVTLSMADQSLRSLYKDVSRIGGRLVIRGLLDNSFQKTQRRLLDLKIGVDIDPPLFEQFQVTRVPTFIYRAEVSEGTTERPLHDRLTGNVTVFYALSQIAEYGDQPGARNLLERLGEPQ